MSASKTNEQDSDPAFTFLLLLGSPGPEVLFV